MILVIDTSSSLSALAVIGGDDLIFGSREPIPLKAVVADPRQVQKVVIATGPGSFTGLRRGASFGVGLAIGLGVPIVPVRTLELHAARGRGRFTAVSEAGRGRFYFLTPGANPTLGSPSDIPTDRPLVGLLSAASQTFLKESGHEFGEVETVAAAAEELLKSAHEVPYGSVKLEYMQSMGAKF
ncbi:MAG TPA: tRNA threonylcarbamoyladenosine biosynthesis protein TsaB [Candidatus Dormibacteraeota bacterium]